MDPTKGGANAMRLAPDYTPPTHARHDGSPRSDDASDDMPAGAAGADAGGEMPGAGAMGGASRGEMPRGEMQGDTAETSNRLAGVTGEIEGAGEMPGALTPADGAFATGTMPMGAMSGGMDAVTGAEPGADGMPSGALNGQQEGAKPGETTPNRATLEGVVGGLTLRGEWRFTLSSVSTGSDG